MQTDWTLQLQCVNLFSDKSNKRLPLIQTSSYWSHETILISLYWNCHRKKTLIQILLLFLSARHWAPKHSHSQCKIKLDNSLTTVRVVFSFSDTLQSRLTERRHIRLAVQSLWTRRGKLAASYSHFILKDMMTYTWPEEFALSGVALKSHSALSQTEPGWGLQTCADKRAWDELSIQRLLPVSKNIKASHFEGNYGR